MENVPVSEPVADKEVFDDLDYIEKELRKSIYVDVNNVFWFWYKLVSLHALRSF